MSFQDTIKQMRGRVKSAKGNLLGGKLGGKLLGGKIGGKLLNGQLLGQGMGMLSGQKLGSGKVMGTARSTIDRMTRQMIERKPGVISMVKEFRPGSRMTQMLRGEAIHLNRGPGASVDGTAARISGGKVHRKDASIAQ